MCRRGSEYEVKAGTVSSRKGLKCIEALPQLTFTPGNNRLMQQHGEMMIVFRIVVLAPYLLEEIFNIQSSTLYLAPSCAELK